MDTQEMIDYIRIKYPEIDANETINRAELLTMLTDFYEFGFDDGTDQGYNCGYEDCFCDHILDH